MAATIDPVALAEALIRRPSVTPRDEGALPHLAGLLEGLGFRCTLKEFAAPGTAPVLNLYARLGTGGRNFCFAGHTDVVPPGAPESWDSDPFTPATRDGFLYGRGAADMKSAIACFVAAVDRFLAERGREFGGSISLLITGDEEGVSINGTRKLLDWIVGEGERLDACLVGEPTSVAQLGDMVKIGRRGSLNATLTVPGVQGHTAYPHLADNAAHRLVGMLAALLAAPLDQGSAHFQPSTLQISTIDIGNPATNVIPGEARAVFNIRFNDRWTSDSVTHWIRDQLDPLGGRYDLKMQVSGESFLLPPGELSDLLGRAIAAETGRTPELSTSGGTSDARFIHRFSPVAEFGMVGATMHKANECVSVADLASLTRIYRRVLDGFFPAT
ncbi:MAG: succinyl-diaminopimelate desuccinylase [Stellaceae bacterium]